MRLSIPRNLRLFEYVLNVVMTLGGKSDRDDGKVADCYPESAECFIALRIFSRTLMRLIFG